MTPFTRPFTATAADIDELGHVNNTVYLRYFPAAPARHGNGQARPRRAVVVMAQWNADEGGHVGVCRLMAALGISAVRLSLPYHGVEIGPAAHLRKEV